MSRLCAPSSPSRTATTSTTPPSAKVWKICARLTGTLGYINFVANPTTRFDEAKKMLYLDIDIDEGKPFYVSRIEFTGNTVTRDPVIRRELLLEEGQVYNSNLWEQSLLRLNQLEYFDPLKVDQDSTATQDQQNNTVSLLLRVHEKGKNSIGLNGGVSGLSGSFLGLNYQTNNFLGLGETLSVQANLGNLQRNLQFGFTEPYFRNKPISLGFQVFSSKYDYNAAKNYQISTGGGNLLSGPAVTGAELQPVRHRPHRLDQLPDPAQLPPRRPHLLLPEELDHRVQSGIDLALPDARLPQRHSGKQRA